MPSIEPLVLAKVEAEFGLLEEELETLRNLIIAHYAANARVLKALEQYIGILEEEDQRARLADLERFA